MIRKNGAVIERLVKGSLCVCMSSSVVFFLLLKMKMQYKSRLCDYQNHEQNKKTMITSLIKSNLSLYFFKMKKKVGETNDNS